LVQLAAVGAMLGAVVGAFEGAELGINEAVGAVVGADVTKPPFSSNSNGHGMPKSIDTPPTNVALTVLRSFTQTVTSVALQPALVTAKHMSLPSAKSPTTKSVDTSQV
jgi:hypothetical protein